MRPQQDAEDARAVVAHLSDAKWIGPPARSNGARVVSGWAVREQAARVAARRVGVGGGARHDAGLGHEG